MINHPVLSDLATANMAASANTAAPVGARARTLAPSRTQGTVIMLMGMGFALASMAGIIAAKAPHIMAAM